MKEMEKNIMCVLLQTLCDKNLIKPKICEEARRMILDTFGGEEDRKEESHGYTQSPC